MMNLSQKSKTVYICSECAYEAPKWNGKCPGCGEWNTLIEEIRTPVQVSSAARREAVVRTGSIIQLNNLSAEGEIRYSTGIKELDRVLGGGLVKGSLVLLSGDPGIGKSTILLQICDFLGQTGKILYVSGEESARQIKLRAHRLGVTSDNLFIMTETDISTIVGTIETEKPSVVIIDSIQTMSLEQLTSSAGSVTQVRESTMELMRVAKSNAIPIFLVGHVNKEGSIAGPKVLEHIVDAVLYFEGERHLSYRILRAVKNRYGSTNEIGVFEMGETGLIEVDNPSLMLLSGRPKGASGTSVACIMEGSRPILAEVQALVTTTGFGNPRRMSTGFDYNRLNLLLAVLEKRAGYFFSNLDAYINIIGGIKLDEPAADLPIALSLVSSLKDLPVNESAIAFGEIGLAGEIRSVGNAAQRISEAARLGFKTCIMPQQTVNSVSVLAQKLDITLFGVRTIREACDTIM
jgi:DNA repair protein RadA/Sms